MKDLILQYFDAFSNLYGIIPMKRAYRIIEKQNPELNLTKEQFAEIVNSIDFNRKFYFILSEDEVYDEDALDCDLFDKLLIAEYLVIFNDPNDYENLVYEQDDRPFYVPEKDELLKYAGQFYYEKNKYAYVLENFIRDNLKLTEYKDIVEDYAAMLRIDDISTYDVIEELRRMGKPKFKNFASKEQAQNFFMLYSNFRNHTRKHTHRGHTPSELDDSCQIDYIPEDVVDIPATVNIPSKNGKCPCGSGKKFKRCCMGKGIYD